MNKKMITDSLTVLICLLVTHTTLTAQTDYNTLAFKERLAIDFGIGVDHSIMGVKILYRSSDKFDIYTGIGVHQLTGIIPVLGVQYNFFKSGEQRFVPFILGQFGKDLTFTLNSHPFDQQLNQSRSQNFYSFNLGVGVRFLRKVPSRFSFSAGLTYRLIDPKIKEFEDEFNAEFTTDHTIKFNHILPTLGVGIKI